MNINIVRKIISKSLVSARLIQLPVLVFALVSAYASFSMAGPEEDLQKAKATQKAQQEAVDKAREAVGKRGNTTANPNARQNLARAEKLLEVANRNVRMAENNIKSAERAKQNQAKNAQSATKEEAAKPTAGLNPSATLHGNLELETAVRELVKIGNDGSPAYEKALKAYDQAAKNATPEQMKAADKIFAEENAKGLKAATEALDENAKRAERQKKLDAENKRNASMRENQRADAEKRFNEKSNEELKSISKGKGGTPNASSHLQFDESSAAKKILDERASGKRGTAEQQKGAKPIVEKEAAKTAARFAKVGQLSNLLKSGNASEHEVKAAHNLASKSPKGADAFAGSHGVTEEERKAGVKFVQDQVKTREAAAPITAAKAKAVTLNEAVGVKLLEKGRSLQNSKLGTTKLGAKAAKSLVRTGANMARKH